MHASPTVNSIHAFLLWGDLLRNLEVPKLIPDNVTGEFPEYAGKGLDGRYYLIVSCPSCKLILNSTCCVSGEYQFPLDEFQQTFSFSGQI